MMSDFSQPREILARMMTRYTGETVRSAEMQVIAGGASGRCLVRVPGHPATAGLIGICWTSERADNASFLPAAHGLAKAGIRVPAVREEWDAGEGRGACLVEDLGEKALLSFRHAPWEQRKKAYCEVFRTLRPLYHLRPDWPLQPPFDAALYRWEQTYFAEHLLGRHLGKNPQDFLSQKPLEEMADWLAMLPRVPIHRDCQSQNLMLRDGAAWLIDFQGMRYGRSEYDIASLLYDPYMALAKEERAELLSLWAEENGSSPDMAIYSACALQRLMQALGAFANIGYNQKKDWYLNLIPTGLKALQEAAALAPVGTHASRVAACLQTVI